MTISRVQPAEPLYNHTHLQPWSTRSQAAPDADQSLTAVKIRTSSPSRRHQSSLINCPVQAGMRIPAGLDPAGSGQTHGLEACLPGSLAES